MRADTKRMEMSHVWRSWNIKNAGIASTSAVIIQITADVGGTFDFTLPISVSSRIILLYEPYAEWIAVLLAFVCFYACDDDHDQIEYP